MKHASPKHAGIEQLLAMRDGQLLDAGVRQHIETCAICRKSLESLQLVREALSGLDDPAPDMDLWERLQAERSQERAPSMPLATTTTTTRTMVTAVAATVSIIAVATVFAIAVMHSPADEFDVNPVSEVTPGSTSLNGPGSNEQAGAAHLTVASLQQRSQELESMLAQLGPQPNVQSLRDTSAVESLQSSIALIDFQLGQLGEPDDVLSEADRHQLWQRRVELMESLFTVRLSADRRDSI